MFTTVVIITLSAPLKLMNVKSSEAFRCQMKSTTLWGPSSCIIKTAQFENLISIEKMLVALQIYDLAMLFPRPHPDYLFEFWSCFCSAWSSHHHFSVLFPLRHCSLIWCIAALDKAASIILFTEPHGPFSKLFIINLLDMAQWPLAFGCRLKDIRPRKCQ